ncbi:MAG: hypothetical protein EBZ59_06775 [Planctomycetia bacterium]|nr:hypothetical protein [Planctomycetia bacterium]
MKICVGQGLQPGPECAGVPVANVCLQVRHRPHPRRGLGGDEHARVHRRFACDRAPAHDDESRGTEDPEDALQPV